MMMKNGYREITVRVYMEETEEMMEAVFTVPCDVDEERVYDKLIIGNRKMSENDNAIYEEMGGRTPQALYDYICRETGWEWNTIVYNVDINLK